MRGGEERGHERRREHKGRSFGFQTKAKQISHGNHTHREREEKGKAAAGMGGEKAARNSRGEHETTSPYLGVFGQTTHLTYAV